MGTFFLSVANYVTLGDIYLTGPLPLVENSGPAHTMYKPYFLHGGRPQKQSAKMNLLFVMLISPQAPGLEELIRASIC